MQFRKFYDRNGNECHALSGPTSSDNAIANGERLAREQEGQKALDAYVESHGSLVVNGVEFCRSSNGAASMRLTGQRFTDILCSEANAEPVDQS